MGKNYKNLKIEIKNRAENESNKFGIGAFYHIEAVAKNAELLANKYNADKEVCIISAWLHDIASITDYKLYEEHHIHGSKIASEILKKFKYDDDKIELVKKCILNHRGSIDNKRLSKEEQIIADADAISHFDSIPSLLYLAYKEKDMNIERIVKRQYNSNSSNETETVTEAINVITPLQKLEDSLTRIQEAKRKCIDSLHKMETDDRRLELDIIRLEMEAAREDSTNTEDLKDDSFIKALNDTTEGVWNDYNEDG